LNANYIGFKDFDIGQTKPGLHSFRLQVFQQIDGSYLELPVAVIKGKKGPTVTVISGQHGNEWNGAFICRLIYENIKPSDINGTIILLPIANPTAFRQGTRVAFPDGVDMNRAWGLSRRRKSTEHLCDLIFNKFIAGSDFVFDIHTGGPGEYLPCVGVTDDKWLDLAKSLNLKIIFKSDDDKTLVSAKKNVSLVFAGREAGIPVMLLEIGYGASVDKILCQSFFNGFKNFLNFVGIDNGSFMENISFKIFSNKHTISAPSAGLFDTSLTLGREIKRNDIIGTISPILSENSSIVKAPKPGVLIYLRRKPYLSEGETLAILAT
jgi:predicted deacylase